MSISINHDRETYENKNTSVFKKMMVMITIVMVQECVHHYRKLMTTIIAIHTQAPITEFIDMTTTMAMTMQ